MRAYCTICSAGKRKEKKPLQAIKRYISPRIKRVYELSQKDGVFFFIISGKYGPLLPTDEIPYYDHLLEPEGVREIGYKLAMFIEEHGITELVLFFPAEEDGEEDSPLVPYRKVVHWAAVAAGIPVEEKSI